MLDTARMYRIDLGSRLAWWFIAGSLVLLGGGLLASAAAAAYPAFIAMTGAIFLVPGFYAVRRCLGFGSATITVTEGGIQFGEDAALPIAWDRIGTITDLPMTADLEVRDTFGERLGVLSSSLAGREEMLQRVLRRVGMSGPRIPAPVSLSVAIRRDTRWTQAFLVAFAGLALFEIRGSLAGPLIVALLFAIWKLYAAWAMGGERTWSIGPEGIRYEARRGAFETSWDRVRGFDVGYGKRDEGVVEHPEVRIAEEFGGVAPKPLQGCDLALFVRAVRAFSGPRWDSVILLDPPPPSARSWWASLVGSARVRPTPVALPSAEELARSIKKGS